MARSVPWLGGPDDVSGRRLSGTGAPMWLERASEAGYDRAPSRRVPSRSKSPAAAIHHDDAARVRRREEAQLVPPRSSVTILLSLTAVGQTATRRCGTWRLIAFGEQVVDAKVRALAKRVGVHEVKTRLSELLRLVYGGRG